MGGGESAGLCRDCGLSFRTFRKVEVPKGSACQYGVNWGVM
jgi:hypothetical protein